MIGPGTYIYSVERMFSLGGGVPAGRDRGDDRWRVTSLNTGSGILQRVIRTGHSWGSQVRKEDVVETRRDGVYLVNRITHYVSQDTGEWRSAECPAQTPFLWRPRIDPEEQTWTGRTTCSSSRSTFTLKVVGTERMDVLGVRETVVVIQTDIVTDHDGSATPERDRSVEWVSLRLGMPARWRDTSYDQAGSVQLETEGLLRRFDPA